MERKSDLRVIKLLLLSCISFLTFTTSAQVWQWSIPVKSATKQGSTAYLWVPEKARRVKAIVIAQHNMEEISILEDAYFRAEMAKLSFAIVWVSPSFNHFFNFKEGAGDVLELFLQDLADSSGYEELGYVPLVPIGHSAAASWPYYLAAWKPGRLLCAISTSGQWPYFRHAQFAPDIWGVRNIDFIPCLETMGEYEAAASWGKEGLKERNEHPYMPLSMLACPGEGHFASSEKKNRYIAFYIKKAAQYRMPGGYTAHAPAQLKPINPTKTGWLMEKWEPGQEVRVNPAPVNEYTGDTAKAFWFFDEEMVRLTRDYQRQPLPARKPQLVSYIQKGEAVGQRNSHLQVHIPFFPLEDGISFVMRAGFLDTVPGESARPASWTGLPVGAALAHSNTPPAINRVAGPFVKINDSTFQFSLERGLEANARHYALTFAATHPGDKDFVQAVQQAEMIVPLKNTQGMAQQIDFPAIPDQKATISELPLKASSSMGLPVYFYIEAGPAFISNGSIVFTPIPRRAKRPVKVTVVAWQYGRSAAPAIQSATPVSRAFYLW